MQLVLNSFSTDILPIDPLLPFLDYPSWEASTEAKNSQFAQYRTWRYEIDASEVQESTDRCRMVFLSGPITPPGASIKQFDLGRFWRIGNILIEQSLAAHLHKQGFSIEEGHFTKTALRVHPGLPSDDAIELAIGISFSAQRPFRDEQYKFAAIFQWVVQARFKDSLDSPKLRTIAIGMPVLFSPSATIDPDLRQFRGGYIGRIKSIRDDMATVSCRDDQYRNVPLRDLRLEASPAVIKLYEQNIRGRTGTSNIIRTIQRLNKSLTTDNRRSLTVLRDRLDSIQSLLHESGSSRDRLIIPLQSFQAGSISISTAPSEAVLGGTW